MSRPNVVVVCCDDLGYGDLGCYGAEYDTPNIDRLAGEGVRFTDWHSNAPVCSPTRAALMTGQYPQRVNMPGNAPQGRPETNPDLGLAPEAPTIANRLGEVGYRTGQFGKWHLGMTERDDPIAHGFDESFGFRSGCVDYYSHIMMWLQANGVPPYHDLWEDREEVRHNGEYLTHLITDRAVEFIEDNAVDGPFFTYVAYNAPHYPMHAPEEYFERVSHLDGDRRTQAAMIAAVDDGIGEILDALDREGIDEETIVVFTSDHGPSREVRNHLDGSLEPYYGGSTGGYRGHKFSLFEGGIRVPGVVRYPAELDGGRECDELALSMDLFPTVLDFCDIDTSDEVDGKSLRSVLADGASTPHERVYWRSGDQLAVRDGDWKLLFDPIEVNPDPDAGHLDQVNDSPYLVDLATDPEESENLLAEHPDVAEELETAARDWDDRISPE